MHAANELILIQGDLLLMNILYIHQYFKTPQEAGGNRSYVFSRKLVSNGHNVTMITSNTDHNHWSFIEEKDIDGIRVIYIKNFYNNKMGITARIVSFIKFMICSTYVAFKQHRVDKVIATSTPLTVGVPALLLHIIKGIPYVFEVRDLWPEFPIQMGVVKNKFLQKVLYSLEELIYKHSQHIIALSPGMQAGVQKQRISSEKISMIPNMSKPGIFFKHEKNVKLAEQYNINLQKFNIVHFGAMGLANELDYIVKAALIAKQNNYEQLNFVLIGNGFAEEFLKVFCLKYRLTNVIFIDALPLVEVAKIVNLCDISIVPFKNIPVLYTNSPNKLFDSLSAGLPIIINSSGWTRQLVETNECGFFVDPDSPKELIDKLMRYIQRPIVLKQMGLNSRALAETRYSCEILSKQFSELIENV